ncbi:MAG: hypothetical protein HY898_22835 [Deltaproteobacteria bacterium]|nr:hypothetical protein [Deltaproteobacteria bacterium]
MHTDPNSNPDAPEPTAESVAEDLHELADRIGADPRVQQARALFPSLIGELDEQLQADARTLAHAAKGGNPDD